MHRLLLLRPISRAPRTHGALPCRRNLVSALSASQSRGFHATSSVAKRKKMEEVDDLFFGEESDVDVPSSSTGKQEKVSAAQPTETTSSTFVAGKGRSRQESRNDDHLTPAPVIERETEVVHKSQARVIESVDFSFLTEEGVEHHDFAPETSIADADFNADEYFSTWFTPKAREALAFRGASQHDYISTLFETDAVQDMFGQLDISEAEDFERLWGVYEWKQDTDPDSVVPVLTFLLRHGVQLTAPSLDSPRAEACIRPVEPSVVSEGLRTLQDGKWRIDDSSKPPSSMIPYPNLMKADPILDPRDVVEFPATPDAPFNNRVVIRNHRSVFHDYEKGVEDDLLADDYLETDTQSNESDLTKSLPVNTKYYQNLHQSILMRRSVVQQTGKGKIRRVAYLVLVGDGNGLVGYGEGKHGNSSAALRMARVAAVRNMDWVERFEKRTIWTEMSTKLGATQIFLRPRPVGFGLRCNPHLHQILRAAGLKDISAKVWGSRNKLNVIKAAFRMLHAGHAPTGMGDGIGGKGKKLSKGSGVRGKNEIERARGRKLISLRK